MAGLPDNVAVVARRGEETPETVARDVGAIGCVQADARLDRVRAFVKVQDGCSFNCNFCVIPIVRGPSRSRRVDAVLAVERLRLSSIEINHVNDELVAALRETPVAASHLHVPIQSGDDGVLRAMGRRYSAATYLRRLKRLGDFNLTTDVIVGFPVEDDPAFERTVDVVQQAGITKVHVFPYSPRPGTATAAEDTVPAQVKKERSARLRALSHEACIERWRTKVGREDVVLVDRPGRGYGDDYSPWLVDAEAEVGRLLAVHGSAVTEEGILAA